jgi:hypothetical protein
LNKRGSDIVAAKAGFYIVFLFLFALGIGYSLKFLSEEDFRKADFIEIEKSILMNRVIGCLSGASFGEIDEIKFNENNLKKCLNNEDYQFFISLTKNDGDVVSVSWGQLALDARGSTRFVLFEEEKARLRMAFSKKHVTE